MSYYTIKNQENQECMRNIDGGRCGFLFSDCFRQQNHLSRSCWLLCRRNRHIGNGGRLRWSWSSSWNRSWPSWSYYNMRSIVCCGIEAMSCTYSWNWRWSCCCWNYLNGHHDWMSIPHSWPIGADEMNRFRVQFGIARHRFLNSLPIATVSIECTSLHHLGHRCCSRSSSFSRCWMLGHRVANHSTRQGAAQQAHS